jgi:hypothetical protein
LIDLQQKDAKHSVYDLQGIKIRVTQDLAKMYVDNGKEMESLMDGMNNAQRFQYQMHKKWITDLQSLGTDIVKEHTNAGYWHSNHRDQMMINKRHKMSSIVAEQLELNNVHQMEALCKLGSIMRAYDNQSECFSRLKLTVKQLKIMHENSFDLPSGCDTDKKFNTLNTKSPPKEFAALEGIIPEREKMMVALKEIITDSNGPIKHIGMVSTGQPILEGCFVTRSYAVENGRSSTYPASPASLESRQDIHAWQGDLAPEDMESQRVGRADCGQGPMSDDAAIAGGRLG